MAGGRRVLSDGHILSREKQWREWSMYPDKAIVALHQPVLPVVGTLRSSDVRKTL